MNEASIQLQIINALRGQGWFVFAVPNHLTRRQPYGFCPGAPDLIAVRKGVFGMLEVKAPGNTQQQNQLDFQAAMDRHDIPYSVVHSAEEAHMAVAIWGQS